MSQNHKRDTHNSNPPCVEVSLATALTDTSCPALYTLGPASTSLASFQSQQLQQVSRLEEETLGWITNTSSLYSKELNSLTQDLGCQWHESIQKGEVVLDQQVWISLMWRKNLFETSCELYSYISILPFCNIGPISQSPNIVWIWIQKQTIWSYVFSIVVFFEKVERAVILQIRCFSICVFQKKSWESAILQICSGQDKKSLQWGTLVRRSCCKDTKTICFPFPIFIFFFSFSYTKYILLLCIVCRQQKLSSENG